MQYKMQVIPKTPSEIHRELLASGIFQKETQEHIAEVIGVNQATVSRIAAGRFRRLNKSVLAVCKYANIKTLDASGLKQLRSLLTSRTVLNDPTRKKLVDIIGLAVDLLDRS